MLPPSKTCLAAEAGDSEDIAILGNTAYILTAGKRPAIYRVADYTGRSPHCDRYDLKLNEEYDPEGLCHDADGNRLLIACKGSPTKGDTERKVFPFDIRSGRRAKSPVLTIDCQDFADEGKSKFNPSGTAVHPMTNDVYLIGTKGVKMLVCCGWDGRVKGAVRLDDDRFEQPEGIAFTESGELLVCSEGAKKKGKKARIFLFAFAP
ncbi:MAG: SdiA-regulated domain-containing protein [Phycisphaerales bacterium]|nr:MAG: SdiA-regulated domain-containing protein [Phycisphaerales bacterium]